MSMNINNIDNKVYISCTLLLKILMNIEITTSTITSGANPLQHTILMISVSTWQLNYGFTIIITE